MEPAALQVCAHFLGAQDAPAQGGHGGKGAEAPAAVAVGRWEIQWLFCPFSGFLFFPQLYLATKSSGCTKFPSCKDSQR